MLFFEKAQIIFSFIPNHFFRLNRFIIEFSGQCYKDYSDRVLKGNTNCIKDKTCFFFSNLMTIDKCKKYCLKNGWAIAGLHNSNECFCGNEFPTEKISPVFCNRTCRGNSSQKCGGAWALNIYYLLGECFISLPMYTRV